VTGTPPQDAPPAARPAPAPAPPPSPAPRRRARYIVALGICLAAVAAIIGLTVILADNVVYFRTVSEAVKLRADGDTGRFRLAGAVVPGSIRETSAGVDFAVTDGRATVNVVHRGDPPELFKANAPVVAEGRWSGPEAVAFRSDRIMIRHGNDYEAPKVDTDRAPAADTGASGR
jgi:cytochrome c-type biogenesis protein CcmE